MELCVLQLLNSCLILSHSCFPLVCPVLKPTYIRASRMDRASTWGTENEILTQAHLLNTPVYVDNSESMGKVLCYAC